MNTSQYGEEMPFGQIIVRARELVLHPDVEQGLKDELLRLLLKLNSYDEGDLHDDL